MRAKGHDLQLLMAEQSTTWHTVNQHYGSTTQNQADLWNEGRRTIQNGIVCFAINLMNWCLILPPSTCTLAVYFCILTTQRRCLTGGTGGYLACPWPRGQVASCVTSCPTTTPTPPASALCRMGYLAQPARSVVCPAQTLHDELPRTQLGGLCGARTQLGLSPRPPGNPAARLFYVAERPRRQPAGDVAGRPTRLMRYWPAAER